MARRVALDDKALHDRFPGGVAPRQALVDLGMSHSTISARCRPGKAWQRPIPGVIVLSDGPLTQQQLRRAALVHAGPDAMVTGIEAARMHGVKRLPADRKVHVLVPHKSGVSSWGFATVERTVHLPEPMEINGLPVAPLARALFDAARHMDRLDEVRAMIADAVGRGLCEPRELKLEIDKGTTIGSALPRRVVHEMTQGIKSAVETWVRRVVKRSRLPAPEWNVGVRTRNGQLLGTAAAYWQEVGLALQVDSREFRLDLPRATRTAQPDTALSEAGVIVLSVLPSDLRDRSLTVAQNLRAAYGKAAGRPPPDLHTGFTPRAA
jgi:hypothetical protein